MSKSAYMVTRRPSTYTILPAMDELVDYIFAVTNSKTQFPKNLSYSLGDKMCNAALDMKIHTYKVIAKLEKHNVSYVDVYLAMEPIEDDIATMQALIDQCIKLAKLEAPGHFGELFTNVTNTYANWVKYVRRRARTELWQDANSEQVRAAKIMLKAEREEKARGNLLVKFGFTEKHSVPSQMIGDDRDPEGFFRLRRTEYGKRSRVERINEKARENKQKKRAEQHRRKNQKKRWEYLRDMALSMPHDADGFAVLRRVS